MKTLHLLRHAKSSWKQIELDDHERPLSKRGRAAARAMAKHMKRADIAPDIVLCSIAVRAKETLGPVAKKLKPKKVLFKRGIYKVPGRQLWKSVTYFNFEQPRGIVEGHGPLGILSFQRGRRWQLRD